MDLLQQALSVLGNIGNKTAQTAQNLSNSYLYDPKDQMPFPNSPIAKGIRAMQLPPDQRDQELMNAGLNFAGMTGTVGQGNPLYRHSAKLWDSAVDKFMGGGSIPEIDSGVQYLLKRASKETKKPIEELLGKYSMTQLIDKVSKLIK